MPHWLQVLLVVTFVASVLQSLFTGYDGNTLRENPSYRPEGSGGILYTLRGGTPSYTHENKRGDVVAKTDGTGTLTYQAQYEAFGKQTATTGSTLDRQKSNSKDTDPTGLVDEGMRYRDLETGMFINRDPAGFVDGPNLYTYVRQNPWSSFDAEGLLTLMLNGQEVPWTVGNQAKAFVQNAKTMLPNAAKALGSDLLAPIHMAMHPVDTAKGIGATASKAWNDPIGLGNDLDNAWKNAPPGSSFGHIASLGVAPEAMGALSDGGKALTKALTPTDSAARTTAETAQAVQAAQPAGKAQNVSTTAAMQVANADGTTSTLVSSSRAKLTEDQAAALQPGEVPVQGRGGEHAEIKLINQALINGQQPLNIEASRPMCPDCANAVNFFNIPTTTAQRPAPVPKVEAAPKTNP